MSSALDTLIQADQALFLWINGQHTTFWDGVMGTFTNKFTWTPLYFFLIYVLVSRFKTRAVGYLVCIIAVVIVSDQIASGLLKPYFMRLRPCYDPEIGSLVRTLKGCGGQYGFVSSHAATGFGIATAINLLLLARIKWLGWLYAWAFVYSYSRIYVGVHYPLDLIGGALVGVGVAFMAVGIYRFSTRRITTRYL